MNATDFVLCKTTDVPLGEGRRIHLPDRVVAVFHTHEGFFAIDDACPHRGGPLGDGLLTGCLAHCPLHNLAVDVRTGQVVSGGEGHVTRYALEQHGDALHLKI